MIHLNMYYSYLLHLSMTIIQTWTHRRHREGGGDMEKAVHLIDSMNVLYPCNTFAGNGQVQMCCLLQNQLLWSVSECHLQFKLLFCTFVSSIYVCLLPLSISLSLFVCMCVCSSLSLPQKTTSSTALFLPATV